MEQIATLFGTFERKSGATSERAFIVGEFYDKLVDSYKQYKGKKYNDRDFKRLLGMKLAHIKTNQELYEFLGQCRYARNFSKYFWWALDPANCRDMIKPVDK